MQELLERGRQVLIGNYARQPIVMVRGEGSYLWDAAGKRYLDLFAGFGGSILGHCHPKLVEAVNQQAATLWQVGNTFHNQGQIELSVRLNAVAFKGKAFFCHSGAEANEAACKLARLRGNQQSPKKQWKIISLLKSFHGRTLAMIAATGSDRFRAGFEPTVQGFVHVPGGDIDALRKAVDDETGAVIMEPIQGEGGMNEFPADYAAQVRQLCDERGMTLIFDEVWTGCGRTGQWFGHQHFKDAKGNVVLPDIMTLGKAIGGGLPVGVMFAKDEIAELLVPGTHGCTLGGNMLCMAAAISVVDTMRNEGLVARAAAMGSAVMARIRNDGRIAGKLDSVRGRGLFIGIELKEVPAQLMDKALLRGLIVNLTAQKVVRLAPALTISQEQLDDGVTMLIDLIASL